MNYFFNIFYEISEVNLILLGFMTQKGIDKLINNLQCVITEYDLQFALIIKLHC